MLIDTHCHIDAYFNLAEVLQNVRSAKIRVVAVTNRPSSYLRLAQRVDERLVRVAVGAHPLEISEMTPKEWLLFEATIASTKYVGEVGLDFSSTHAPSKRLQTEAFDRICRLLSRQQRIVTVHSRRAASAVLRLLTENRVGPVIFHWFSGSLNELEALLDAGHFLSLNASMCRSKRGKDIIAAAPLDRVLLETDGPYARIAGRQSWPSDIRTTCLDVSRALDISEDDLERATMGNFKRLAAMAGITPQRPA